MGIVWSYALFGYLNFQSEGKALALALFGHLHYLAILISKVKGTHRHWLVIFFNFKVKENDKHYLGMFWSLLSFL